MRILVIDNLAVASSRRAIYRSISDQIGEEVYLLTPQSWREQGVITECETEPTSKLKIFSSPFLFGYRHQRIIYLKLKKVIREVKPDIIFISSEPENFNTFHLVWTVKHLFPEIKIACATWRNISYRNNPYPYKFGWINRLIESYTKKRIDICFAHSRTAEMLMKEISNWGAVYTPPSINIDDFPFEPKLEKSRNEKFVVGYIGRLVPEKGVDILLRAISLTDNNIFGYIVGCGPGKDSLLKLAKGLNVEDRITWHNAVEFKEVPKLMKSFDILVLPSKSTKIWKEQFGRVLIEAMACGIPVIGSKSGEIPNVVGNGGLVFDEGNFRELANAIQTIQSSNTIRDNLIKRGREKVEKEYNINRAVNSILVAFTKSYNS
jgi:glycosyltransferase involved in cell wall biosynthesis